MNLIADIEVCLFLFSEKDPKEKSENAKVRQDSRMYIIIFRTSLSTDK